ncbi:S1-like domain-containing RNA-binding protein [Fluviicola sp.]|uniref:CvfB family protein n=1 Tax=Fluviicola sp. TaxID=1917219 RepID=UPI0028234146|nr:S1-like domain-containing RNA-binding protein [Fluviicola sp.]MDR0802033.1 GntR family transcriptional regulator [Fluviicola sp.]
MELGVYNELRLDRFTDPGAYLEDEEGNDVLLPTKYVDPSFQIDDLVNVFLYKDSEGRIIATTLVPKILVNQFAFLKIVEVNQYGAFAEWGVEKHLLIPFREQPKPLEEGKHYFIYMYIDEATQRLVGTSRIGMYIRPVTDEIQENEAVDLLVWEFTDLGLKVLVNNQFQGLIFKNDLHRRVRMGETLKGFVRKVRSDGKLDIVLQPAGYEKIDTLSRKFLAMLHDNDGFLDLTDKSDPEEIQYRTGWSKKLFKQVVGNLYKQRLISLHENGITLIDEN